MEKDFEHFLKSDQNKQIKMLYLEGTFVVSIRYYGYKVNLYLLFDQYVEVFYNHKLDHVERISQLDYGHSRMKFYADQISITSIAS